MSGGIKIQAAQRYIRNYYIPSNLPRANCKIVCCEKALKPITPSWCFEHQWQREKNFGMGKVNWMTTIGNSHTSQKRCQRLNDDWYLNNVQMLKVQSSLQGNLKGYTDGWSSLFQLDCLYPRHSILLCFELCYFLLVHN